MIIPKVPEQETMILCKLNGVDGIGYNDVKVGRKPDKIEKVECLSYEWDNINCTFEKPYNPITVDYKIQFNYVTSSQIYDCNEGVNKNPYFFSCQQENVRKFFPSINFTLTAKNRFGSNEKVFQVNLYDIVVAPAIDAYKIQFLETTSDSVLVSWNVSSRIAKYPKTLDFEFKIIPRKDCGVEKIKHLTHKPALYKENPIVNYKDILKLDFAHTWYDIAIRMKVSSAENVEKMWSAWTQKQVKSGKRQPDYPPPINPGAFSTLSNGDIYIYWKPLSRCHFNGENINYTVTSSNKKHVKPHEQNLKYAIYRSHQIDSERDTEIIIRSFNEIGSSVNSSLLVIPAKNRILEGPKIKKISNNGTYTLSWSPPEFRQEEIVSYTVFWCTAKTELNNRCESDIDFKEFNASQRSFEFKSDQTVNFAISANSRNSTSGMIWAKCTTANINEIGKIKYIWIPKLTSREIEIAWKTECTDSGIIAGYQIEYCPVKQPKTLECKEPEEKLNLTTSSLDKYTLSNLRPYTIYKIIIRMFSNSTMGPPSEPMSNTTLEDAPSEVRNLIARNVKNTTVDLYWDPPEFFNGVLNDYEVHINGTPIKVAKNEENQTARVNYTVINLQPFAKYDIAVRACTNKCSDPAKSEIRTEVGAPGNITEQLRIENQGTTNTFNSSYTSAIISWSDPTYKGGNLDYYELKSVFYSNDGSSTPPKIVKLKSNKCFMEKVCVNNITGQYDFSVRGVNFVFTPHASNNTFKISGSHEIPNCETGDLELMKSLEYVKKIDPHGWHVAGFWSPSYWYSCHSFNFDTKQYVLIVCLMIASLVFVVMVFYLYRKIKDMKDILVQMPPGLEDLTGDKILKKGKDHSLSKIEKPDLLHNIDNTFINNEDEHGRLLRRSMNGSLNGGDCSSSMHSDSTRSEMDHIDMSDEIAYSGLDGGKPNSLTETDKTNDFLSGLPTGKDAIPVLLSSEIMAASTPVAEKYSKPNAMSSKVLNPSNGYVAAPISNSLFPISSSGYVTHSIFNPLQSGYTQLNALGKPIINDRSIAEKMSLKTPIVATTDQEGISGYVTHKQLSDFGHRMQ